MERTASKFVRVKLFANEEIEVLEAEMNAFMSSFKGVIIDIKFEVKHTNTAMIIYTP